MLHFSQIERQWSEPKAGFVPGGQQRELEHHLKLNAATSVFVVDVVAAAPVCGYLRLPLPYASSLRQVKAQLGDEKKQKVLEGIRAASVEPAEEQQTVDAPEAELWHVDARAADLEAAGKLVADLLRAGESEVGL